MMQKMEQLNIRMPRRLVEEIDAVVGGDSVYRSRSDFIRAKLVECVVEGKSRKLDEAATKARSKVRERGGTLRQLTREDKDRIAREFLREKGLI